MVMLPTTIWSPKTLNNPGIRSQLKYLYGDLRISCKKRQLPSLNANCLHIQASGHTRFFTFQRIDMPFMILSLLIGLKPA